MMSPACCSSRPDCSMMEPGMPAIRMLLGCTRATFRSGVGSTLPSAVKSGSCGMLLGEEVAGSVLARRHQRRVLRAIVLVERGRALHHAGDGAEAGCDRRLRSHLPRLLARPDLTGCRQAQLLRACLPTVDRTGHVVCALSLY